MKTMRMWAMGAALISAAGMGAPIAAQASSDGSKNTAIALGAAALYELVNHKTTEALVLGAGAAVAAKQSSDAHKKETQRRPHGRYYYDNNGNYSNSDEYNRDRQNSNSAPYDRGGNSYDYGSQYNQYRGDQQNSGDGDYDRNDSSYNYGNQNNQNRNDSEYDRNGNWGNNGNPNSRSDYSARPGVSHQNSNRSGDQQDFRHLGGANRNSQSGQWSGPSVWSLQKNSR